MHALVVRGTIHSADGAQEILDRQVVSLASGAPEHPPETWRLRKPQTAEDGSALPSCPRRCLSLRT